MNRRRLKLARRLHLALDAALAAILLAIATLVSLRFDATFTFRNADEPLTQRATSLLSRLDGPVRCIAVIPHDNVFYASVRKLLLDMRDAAAGADFTLEFPDPHVDISRAASVTLALSSSLESFCFPRRFSSGKAMFSRTVRCGYSA